MKRVIHFNAKYIKRSEGGSVVGFAAYCAGERLQSQYDGRIHYKKRTDVIFKKVLLPTNAPEIYKDREVLWNAVEMVENGKAQLARSIDLDLPVELNRAEHVQIILNYVQRIFVDQGMCADIAIHDNGNGNPHAHILLTLRSINEEGEWNGKWKKNYILDEYGNKIYDHNTKRYKCGPSIPLNDWGNHENVEKWRQEWANECNCALARKHVNTRVTHESYVRQGVDRKPQIHLGRIVCALEQRGIHTERGNENRDIIERNRLQHKRSREQKRSRNLELYRG
ncbi:MAG: MobA/MobL family protein [Lachnospiraceae bacterium]|nr:MobA/MobL family protein [Lachnospiraceae bacterium]